MRIFLILVLFGNACVAEIPLAKDAQKQANEVRDKKLPLEVEKLKNKIGSAIYAAVEAGNYYITIPLDTEYRPAIKEVEKYLKQQGYWIEYPDSYVLMPFPTKHNDYMLIRWDR